MGRFARNNGGLYSRPENILALMGGTSKGLLNIFILSFDCAPVMLLTSPHVRGMRPPDVNIASSKFSSRLLPAKEHQTNHIRLYGSISKNPAWTDFCSLSNHFWVTVILGEVPKDDELNEIAHWDATLVGDSADLFLVGWRDPKNEIWASHHHIHYVITMDAQYNIFTNTGYL